MRSDARRAAAGLFWIAGLTAAAVGAIAAKNSLFPHAAHTREAIAALRLIRDQCLAEPPKHATVRCQTFLDATEACPALDCDLDETYTAAGRAGFSAELPPLHASR